MSKNNKQTFDISISSVLKIIAVILALFFLYLIRDIFALLFVAVIFASALESWVDRLQENKVPRAVSILSIYVIGLAVIALATVLIIPILTTELTALAHNFPAYYQKVLNAFGQFKSNSTISADFSHLLNGWTSNLISTTRGVFSTIGSIFGGIISCIAVLAIIFYLLVEKNNMRNFLQLVTPKKYHAYAIQLYGRVQKKIGSWLTGQLFLMLIIAVLTYIGLLVLGVRYTLVLALIAGLTEVIPYIGPLLGAIPAVLIAFTDSPVKGFLTILLFVIIQQLENSVIVPKVMKRAVGLNPIVVIIAVLIGGQIAGIVGSLLAVPIATIISVLIKDFLEITKGQET